MNKRDLFFAAAGMLLGLVGISTLLYGSLTLALVILFMLITLLFALLVLQRRQLAAVQERTLSILRGQKRTFSQLELLEKLSRTSRQRKSTATSRQGDSTDHSTKKVIGLLSAQQVSMDILNNRIEDIVRNMEQKR